MKKSKSAGVDNIPAELVQARGEDVITALKTICNTIWQTEESPAPWTQSLVITVPLKGKLQECQNYRTVSLISHPSKVMLKIILSRKTAIKNIAKGGLGIPKIRQYINALKLIWVREDK